MPYEKIIVSGKGYISTEALSLLSENNRNLILLDTYGKPITFCNGDDKRFWLGRLVDINNCKSNNSTSLNPEFFAEKFELNDNF